MKVPLSWLREFVPVEDSAEAVARTLSVRGFAVEGIEHIADEAVLDFEVTANRPDCMSVIGMAREVAVAYGLLLSGASLAASVSSSSTDVRGAGPAASVSSSSTNERGAGPAASVFPSSRGPADLDIIIENPELCPRYAGAVVDVAVATSPDWMQRRLHAAGIRPISNVVDITNYVLLELGHPMHAFDLSRLTAAQIRVRTARTNETIRTLDGQTRTLSPDMLVIADAERAVAVAGVMGGADSEVSHTTRTVVLESAYFNPVSVRRTSRKLGLKTEASMRFERGADPASVLAAMHRAVALIETIGASHGRGGILDRYPVPIEPRTIRLRRSRIGAVLGGSVPDTDVRRILDGLGFSLRDVDEGWDVTVPTRRVDVLREIDLIEELARHYGFDRLPATFPDLTTAPPPGDPRIARTRQLRGILTAAGFSEAVTFGFTSEPAASRFASADELVAIANPLSENFAVLRPSVLPGLIDAVAHNRRREQRDIRLFEIGARFTRSGGERRTVACAWTGLGAPEHWSGTGRAVEFFDIKAVVERVCQAIGGNVDVAASTRAWLTAGRSADVRVDGTNVGVMGQLSTSVADAHGLPVSDPVYVAEIDLEQLEEIAAGRIVRVVPLPRFPSVTRDISVLVPDHLTSAEIRRTIREAAPSTLVRVSEFDRYQGKGVPEGTVSLSLHLTFRSSDRTLTDVEVQTAMDGILGALKKRHGAVQR